MQVNYLGKELVSLGYVTAIPAIEESKGFGRGKLNSADLTLTLPNIDDQFSVDNPLSMLSGSYWQYQPITIYDDENSKIFDGQVVNIIRRHEGQKTVDLICRDIMFEYRKTPISYTSSDWETPATAAYNMMVAAGFTDYDNASFQSSISILTAAACYCKVYLYRSDNVSLFGALEMLGLYGCADVYTKGNKLFYQTWQQYTGGVSVAFDYNDPRKMPLTAPTITTDEKNIFNDYSIGYDDDAGVPATDAANGNIGAVSRANFGTQAIPEVRSEKSTTNRVAFKDLTSAVFIGELFIKRGHFSLTPHAKALQQIAFVLDYSFYQYVELGTYFKMTFPDEGWTDKIFEISSIKRDHQSQTISLEAWEVVT